MVVPAESCKVLVSQVEEGTREEGAGRRLPQAEIFDGR